MKKIMIIKNEQHSLLPCQEEILARLNGNIEVVNIPAKGLTYREQLNLAKKWRKEGTSNVAFIFLSPLPILISYLSSFSKNVWIFHNDTRQKKELPNGKVIFTVPETGWQLVNPVRNEIIK